MTTTELGQALRRWRDRLSPDTAGLRIGGQRRAAGLRREELALLAGISVDYVTRLEQGRAANPSAEIVEALARALRLTGDERAYLFGLAGWCCRARRWCRRTSRRASCGCWTGWWTPRSRSPTRP
ncbi:hypothetical protein GCM10018780_06730 [Streptomyces lanatus]|nr:hypothetical protein GCM10018780_06730 [Streptomyces lanatus]